MIKANSAINKINFILFVNLLALIVMVNISAVSLNNELSSLDGNLDRLTDEMRRYNESYPTVHLVEFSDFKNMNHATPSSETTPLATYTSGKDHTQPESCEHKAGKETTLAEKKTDTNVKGFMIDQVGFFIIATPVIAFFLLFNRSVGVGINKLAQFLK